MEAIKRIKIALIERGITQTDLAKRLGVQPQQICDVLHGRIRTPYIREGICRILSLEQAIWSDT